MPDARPSLIPFGTIRAVPVATPEHDHASVHDCGARTLCRWRGYLTKDHSPEQLVEAIHRVARGGKYISETLAEKLAGLVDLGTLHVPHEQLSDREFEVLCSLGRGMTVKDVAMKMQLSAKTISTYRVRLLEKMGLTSNADLVRYVVEHDLMK